MSSSIEERKWPFFIVVDDAGFPSVDPGTDSLQITMDFYCNVLKLAKQYGMQIPLCFTLKYLDVNHIDGEASPLPYADDLISFIRESAAFVEFGFHGLTHEYNGQPFEFFDIYTNSRVPYGVQYSHILESFKIIESLNLSKPEIFVPPGHAWEPGVTDRLLSECGIKYIISTPRMKFNGRSYQWRDSRFLSFLPRTSMGVYHADTDLSEGIRKKTKLGPIIVNAKWVKKLILPRSLFYNLRCERRLVSTPIHSYMTHIGNFSTRAMGFWREVLDFVLERKEIHLCRTSAEAEKYYKALIGPSSFSTT